MTGPRFDPSNEDAQEPSEASEADVPAAQAAPDDAAVTEPTPDAGEPATEPQAAAELEPEPADTAPADTAPADTEPADTAPADTAPGDTEPAAEPEAEPFEMEPATEAEAEAEPPEMEPAVVEPGVEAAPEPAAEPAAEVEPASDAELDEDEAIEAGSDPFRGPGDWYVVHTYAGYENKVKTNLESRIHTMQMEDKIFHVHIPMEDVMEIKGGKRQVVQRKVFPGYLLVKMVYDNDSWYVVRNTPGVTGFVAAGTGSKPTPLSRREVEKILSVKKEEVKPQLRLGFEVDDVVRIISGPFADFNGTISDINPEQGKLRVLVNIFDRETPVELSFDQVAKV